MRRSAIVALLTASLRLGAQTRAEIVRGVVTDPAHHPVGAAAISITMAPDRQVFETRADSLGAYAIRIANGTGDYLVHVTKIGFTPFRKRVTRVGTDSLIVVDVEMKPIAQALGPVRVIAQKPKPSRTADPGTETGAAEKLADSFTGAVPPSLAGDVNAIASTIPGLTPTAGGFSVMGVDPSQNSVTLNGMSFAAGAFPRAAQTNVRVSTTTYDPARGWFGGANTNIEFGNGGVFSTRRVFATLDAPQLQYTDPISARLGQRFTNVNMSIGGSGPIDTFDRYFYSYGVQAGRKVADAASVLTADPDLLQHAGVAADSVNELLQILRTDGIPATVPRISNALLTDNASILARFDHAPYDWKALAPSKTTMALTLFANWSRAHPISLSPTAAPSHSADNWSASTSAQALYSTYFGNDYLTTTRSAFSYSVDRTRPYLELPSASALVASTFPDGSGGVTTLDFAGNGTRDQESNRWTWETTHETQFYTQGRRSLHRVKISADARLDGYDASSTTSLGRYSYNSLADLSANRPASFTRIVDDPARRGAEANAYAAIGDLWRVTPSFQLLYGARLEGNTFVVRPDDNPLIERAFGARTDEAPRSLHASPRLGFTWVRHGAANNGAITFNPMGLFNMGPTSYIRGGIGEFRSLTPITLLSDPFVQTGLPGALASVTCVGDAVPRPNWNEFLANAASIPESCAAQSSASFAQTAPSVRLIDHSYRPPRSWRGNLSYSSQYRRVMYSVDGTFSLNLDGTSRADLNLRSTPSLTLSDEQRPVFARANDIVPATGVVSRVGSRVDSALDQVIATRADAKSVSRQLIFTISPDLFEVSNWLVSLSYVLGKTRALTDGFSATTAGSPFVREWSRGPLDARHQFLVQAGYSVAGVTFSAFARATSGLPFTPMVGGDVNGDGFTNDRAFIRDPASTRSAQEAAAMHSVIASANPRVRACLERGLGAIAAAASCEGPWTTSMNAALTLRSGLLHLGGRISQIQLAFSNPLGGLDQALHGTSHLRGWGLQSVPDPVLYYVRGFDPVNRSFQYDVNPRFGNTDPARSILRAPFRLTLDVTLNLSRDFGLQQLERYLRPGRGGHPGPRLGVAELKRRYERSVPDPYAGVLLESDSLLLTKDQVSGIQQAQSHYRSSMDTLWTHLAEDFAALPDTFDVAAAVQRQEQTIDDGWEIARLDVHAQLPKILSPVQLAILPGTAGRLFRAPSRVRQGGRTLFP
jgi:hypothetical protein